MKFFTGLAVVFGLFITTTSVYAEPIYKTISQASFTVGSSTGEKLAFFSIDFEVGDNDQSVYVPINTFNLASSYGEWMDDIALNYSLITYNPNCNSETDGWCGGYQDPKARGIVLSTAKVVKDSVYLVEKGAKEKFTLVVFLPYTPYKEVHEGVLDMRLIPLYLGHSYIGNGSKNKFIFSTAYENGLPYEPRDKNYEMIKISAGIDYKELSTAPLSLKK